MLGTTTADFFAQNTNLNSTLASSRLCRGPHCAYNREHDARDRTGPLVRVQSVLAPGLISGIVGVVRSFGPPPSRRRRRNRLRRRSGPVVHTGGSYGRTDSRAQAVAEVRSPFRGKEEALLRTGQRSVVAWPILRRRRRRRWTTAAAAVGRPTAAQPVPNTHTLYTYLWGYTFIETLFWPSAAGGGRGGSSKKNFHKQKSASVRPGLVPSVYIAEREGDDVLVGHDDDDDGGGEVGGGGCALGQQQLR